MQIRRSRVSWVVLIPWLALQACGRTDSDSESQLQSQQSVAALNFQDWCDEWGLECPTTPPDNVPFPDRPWTVDQWRSALAVFHAATSDSHLHVTRAELDDANLAAAASAFRFDELLDGLKDRLDASLTEGVTLQEGMITMSAADASDFVADSGLVVHTEATARAHITADHQIALSGFGLSGAKSGRDSLVALDVTDTNVLSWRGDATQVDGVPIKFLFDEVAGLTLGADQDLPRYVDMQPGFMPLKDWIVTGQRDIDVGQEAMREVAARAPDLIADQKLAAAMRYILPQLTALRSTSETRARSLIDGAAAREFKCVMGGETEITFERSFGVRSMNYRGTNVATVVMYGVRAKRIKGLIRPSFRIERVDLEPRRIVIHNVPLIGTYVIDMDDPNAPPLDYRCG